MRWSSLFVPTGFLVSRRTFRKHQTSQFRLQDFHLLWLTFPSHSSIKSFGIAYQVPPIALVTTFGIVVTFFSSPYWDISIRVVSPTLRYTKPSTWWVFPFGFPRIVAYLQLPVAFRRSSRPSSPSSAKASTVRPLFLNLFLKIYISCKFLRISNSTKFYLIFKDLFQKPKSLKAIYDNMQNIFLV